MPLLNISGIDVEFPFEAYPCQIAYMEKVIECLKNRSNGILESPTGTGKTLNLLCSSLAWLQYERDTKLGSALANGSLAEAVNNGTGFGADAFDMNRKCQIIYTSRTHAQLMQAMREFRRTAYAARFRAIALGARDHLCLNTSVMKESNSAVRVHMCRAKVSARACYFHNNIDKTEVVARQEMCLDIEDLVKIGSKHSFCPYYMSKKLTPDYDIIFMPYNYVLTKSMRKANNIDLKNSIVIFDEAHNVHRVCEDASSIELTSSELALAIDELTQVGKLLANVHKPDGDAQQEESMIWSPPVKGKGQSGPKEDIPQITFQEAMELKKMLLDLEEALDHVPLDDQRQFPGSFGEKTTKQKSFEGHEIYNVFREAGITFSSATRQLDLISRAVDFLNQDAAQNQSTLFRSRGSSLTHISDCLNVVFAMEDNTFSLDKNTESRLERENSKEFKMHIAETDPSNKRTNKQEQPGTSWEATQKSQNKGRCLSYWCLSASHAMRDLPSLGVRSVLLTSGTLSPMSALKVELGLPFEVVFQNQHVISSKQCHVAIINKGTDRTELKSTYQCRDSPDYMHSLGMLLLNLARRVTGGTLVFFPSYTLLDACVSAWQRQAKPGMSPVFTTLNDVRRVIVEPRGKAQFSRTYEEYDTTINERGGAILLAVCRGKASEGIDFSDYQSRLVVIVGLPYPPIFDPRVVLKMAYLDDLARKGVRLPNGEKLQLSGREWYEQEAMRAINQAIGRVIRHRWDYGFVVLADSRFSGAAVRSQLPLWLQSSLVPYGENVGKLFGDISEFYRLAMLEFDHDPLAQRLLELTKANSSISSANLSSQAGSANSFNTQITISASKQSLAKDPVLSSPTASFPCSQKPSPCCASAAALKAIYGSQAAQTVASSSKPADEEESVFSCLENNRKPQTPMVASVVKTLPALEKVPNDSPSISANQRKRKLAIVSPPGVQPLQPASIANNAGDKEMRIRQIAALLPADKREKLFRPFLMYRKAVSERSDPTAMQSLLKELSSQQFATLLKTCGKELNVLSEVIHPNHKEIYLSFLQKNT